MTETISIHGDDTCNLQLLPAENFDFCKEQYREIVEFAEKNRMGIGFKKIYVRREHPAKLRDKNILKSTFENAMKNILPKLRVKVYDFFAGVDDNIGAFGYAPGFAVFYDFDVTEYEKLEIDDDDEEYDSDEVYYSDVAAEGIITKIWFRLCISERHEESTRNLLAALTKIGDFIIADWRTGFVEKLSDYDKIIQQYQNKEN